MSGHSFVCIIIKTNIYIYEHTLLRMKLFFCARELKDGTWPKRFLLLELIVVFPQTHLI